jgi:hypothetical protein
MSCERGQRYILGADDVLLPSLVTADNKNNLSEGGLFDGIEIPDLNQNISGNFDLRTLHNSSGDITVDWENANLEGNWLVTGDLTVSGNVVGDIDASQLDWSAINTDFIIEGENNYYITKPRLADWVGDLIEVEEPIEKTVSTDSVTQDTIITLGLGTLTGLPVTDKTIHVSPAGTNSRELTDSKYDLSKPFQTVQAAADAAASGDVIMVWPGTYNNEYDLLKNGVNYYFQNGAVLVQSTGMVTNPPFVDNTEVVSCEIRGHGEFISNDAGVTEILRVARPGSNIIFEAKSISSTASTSSSKQVIKHESGTLRLVCESITSTASGILSTSGGKLYVKNSYVSASGGPGIQLNGTDTVLTIDNCQVGTTNLSFGALYLNTALTSTPVAIKNSMFVVPRTGVDYAIKANVSDTPSISILPGNCANKDLQRNDIIVSELSPFTVDLSIDLPFV